MLPEVKTTRPPTNVPTHACVLVVNSSSVTRLGLTMLIRTSGRFALCGDTADAPTARALFVRHQPHLVVLGLTLQRGDGIELIKDFRKLNPASRILVLSTRNDMLSIQRAFRAGALGYVVTHDNMSEVLAGFDQVLMGQLYVSESIKRRMLEKFACGEIESVTSEMRILSDRELQVVALLGRGFGATRLARELHLSVKTIETHQMRIKHKLGLRTASELNEKAARWVFDGTKKRLRQENNHRGR